jgi:hypothetical protein
MESAYSSKPIGVDAHTTSTSGQSFRIMAYEQDGRDRDAGLCQHRFRELDVLTGVRGTRFQEYRGLGHP